MQKILFLHFLFFYFYFYFFYFFIYFFFGLDSAGQRWERLINLMATVSKDSAKREEMKKNLLVVCCSWSWRRGWGQLVFEPRLAGQPSSLPCAHLALFLLLMTRGWKWRANDRNWSNACGFFFFICLRFETKAGLETLILFSSIPFSSSFLSCFRFAGGDREDGDVNRWFSEFYVWVCLCFCSGYFSSVFWVSVFLLLDVFRSFFSLVFLLIRPLSPGFFLPLGFALFCLWFSGPIPPSFSSSFPRFSLSLPPLWPFVLWLL